MAEPGERAQILGTLLGAIGDSTEILSPFQCDYGYRISVGPRSFINFGTVILDSAEVPICPGVTIGAGAVIGAGSVVTAEMPARHLCLGNPRRPVREA